MCGIAGVFDPKGSPYPEEALAAMQKALVHRGPDDAGLFSDGGVGLAFRRLSILDLNAVTSPCLRPTAASRSSSTAKYKSSRAARDAQGAGLPVCHPFRYRDLAGWILR